MNPHFSSPFNFGAIPRQLSGYEKSRIVILPVPYDATTSFKPGARDGPSAIISASRSMELFDLESGKNLSELGICTLDELDILVDPEKMASRVCEAVMQLLHDKKFVVMLGGEHSLSIGSVRAFKDSYPGLSVLHLDAHADLRDENGGSRFDHGCAARRISEICPVVQAGIRSLSKEEADFIKESKQRIFFAKDMAENDSWMDEAISALGDEVYVTLDLDVLDPGIMPSVGTPEPGGLGWYPLLAFLKRVSGKKKVVGFDVVELSPQKNVSSDFLAAKLVYKMMGYFNERNLH
ncbi:agmatinase [Candidatus Woesearchaeota archaeon]|nr:agmatinase [Candidatus Woesearchaeota archaeon]